MNDRYLFKAKRKNWRELPKEEWWVVGYLYRLSEEHPPFIMLKSRYGESHEIDESTICACTSLKDKNGTLIWENDIVCHKYYEDKEPKRVGVVGFGDFNCSCCHGVYGWHFGDEDIRDVASYAVIGNIFDNPELLEVE